jgi:hypothetical protein
MIETLGVLKKWGVKGILQTGLLWALVLFTTPLMAGQPSASPPTQADSAFSSIFSEKILSVTREVDGILPGTLRSALIQATGIRAQNPFTVVKINFDSSVKTIRVTKGPLPEISGSLTTLDCQTSIGRVAILGPRENGALTENQTEFDGLKISSSSNAIRNCHVTGFSGVGIWIGGNRNLIEYNTVGYHPEVTESAIEGDNFLGEIKSNQSAGIYLTERAAENLVQYNELIANGSNGIEISPQSGGGNKLAFNFFAKNQGKPIKSFIGTNNTPTPQIASITPQGEVVLVNGTAARNSEFQLYMQGKEEGEIGQILIPGTTIPNEQYSILTKNLGFIPHQTKLVAITQLPGKNTSEFSQPVLILGPNAIQKEAPESLNSIFSKEKPPIPTIETTPPSSIPKIDEDPEVEYIEEDVPYNLQGLGTPPHEPVVGNLAQR